MMRWLPCGLLALLLVASGCDSSAHVVKAPGYPRQPGASVSVLGVYRDGRLAPEAWDTLRPHLGPLFGAPTCDPGYPDILSASGTQTLQAVEDFARANGVTDELFDRLAPAAKGDFVLLVTMTGRPGVHSDHGTDSATTPPTFRGTGRHAPSSAPRRTGMVQANAFEMAGIVFSVKARQAVGVVDMTYEGESLEEAIDRFMAKMGAELPQSRCAGWGADLHLEAAEIRRLGAE